LDEATGEVLKEGKDAANAIMRSQATDLSKVKLKLFVGV
jgi:hypothetical protein